MDKTAAQNSQNIPKKPYDSENLNESLKVIQLLEDLRLSSIRGNLEGVKSAIQQGISVNQTLKGGWSPLLFACSMGHPDVVEYLLSQGADPDFHKERFTALMAACASTRENEAKLVKCVDLLVKYNADINATERHHISALMFAAKEGHTKIVTKLTTCNCTLDLQDGQGWTALFWAVNQGKVKVVEILVKAGASTEIKDRRGQTAIDLAYSKGLDEISNIFSNKNKSLEEPLDENQISVSPTRNFNDMYEDMMLELDHNNVIDNRYEKDKSTMLVKIGKLNGVHLKQNRCRNLKKDTQRIKERFKRDKNSNYIVATDQCKDEAIPWNTPYSLGDAVLLMKTTMKHLGVLYAGTSYIRLRLQGRQVDIPVEKKYANTAGLASMTEKALKQTYILQEELKFLHQHVKKLEESDSIVPADVVVEKKEKNYRRLTTLILISVAVVLIYNSKSNLRHHFNAW